MTILDLPGTSTNPASAPTRFTLDPSTLEVLRFVAGYDEDRDPASTDEEVADDARWAALPSVLRLALPDLEATENPLNAWSPHTYGSARDVNDLLDVLIEAKLLTGPGRIEVEHLVEAVAYREHVFVQEGDAGVSLVCPRVSWSQAGLPMVGERTGLVRAVAIVVELVEAANLQLARLDAFAWARVLPRAW